MEVAQKLTGGSMYVRSEGLPQLQLHVYQMSMYSLETGTSGRLFVDIARCSDKRLKQIYGVTDQ